MIELKLKNRYITADILKQLNLEPKCLYCENSEPTELMRYRGRSYTYIHDEK